MAAESSEQEQRAVRQRDAVAHAESQLARERRSREELEQMLAEQSRQDSEQRMAGLAAVARAESAAEAELEHREALQRSLAEATHQSETLATEPGAEAVEVSKTAVLAAAEAASATISLAYIVLKAVRCASLQMSNPRED